MDRNNPEVLQFYSDVEAEVTSRFRRAGSGMMGAASADTLTHQIRAEVRRELTQLDEQNTPPHPRSLGSAVLTMTTVESPDA